MGEKYAMVCAFMYRTGTRISATFNLKWSDIKEEIDDFGNADNVMRHLIDKGAKLNDKLITSEYYKQLHNLLYQGDDSQTLFHKIQKRIFESLIQDFCKETGRDITPHRFKVGGVTRIYNTTGAIRAAQRFADHEDILTTLRYIRDSGSNRHI